MVHSRSDHRQTNKFTEYASCSIYTRSTGGELLDQGVLCSSSGIPSNGSIHFGNRKLYIQKGFMYREREREEDEAGALHCHTWTHRRGGRRPVARSGSSCRREEGVGSAGSGVGRTVRERIGSVQARAPTEARPRPRRESRSTPWSGLRASACRCSNRPIL
jgi:hypothetical protein